MSVILLSIVKMTLRHFDMGKVLLALRGVLRKVSGTRGTATAEHRFSKIFHRKGVLLFELEACARDPLQTLQRK